MSEREAVRYSDCSEGRVRRTGVAVALHDEGSNVASAYGAEAPQAVDVLRRSRCCREILIRIKRLKRPRLETTYLHCSKLGFEKSHSTSVQPCGTPN